MKISQLYKLIIFLIVYFAEGIEGLVKTEMITFLVFVYKLFCVLEIRESRQGHRDVSGRRKREIIIESRR